MQSRLSHIKRRYCANQIGLFQGSESEKSQPTPVCTGFVPGVFSVIAVILNGKLMI